MKILSDFNKTTRDEIFQPFQAYFRHTEKLLAAKEYNNKNLNSINFPKLIINCKSKTENQIKINLGNMIVIDKTTIDFFFNVAGHM